MPLYSFKCERCNRYEDRFYVSYDQMVKEPPVRCLFDGSRMERVATAPAFKVEGYSYANGYSEEKS